MTGQTIALKIGGTAAMFVWAFVSLEYRWGFLTLVFAAVGLGLGASAARDLARLSAKESSWLFPKETR